MKVLYRYSVGKKEKLFVNRDVPVDRKKAELSQNHKPVVIL